MITMKLLTAGLLLFWLENVIAFSSTASPPLPQRALDDHEMIEIERAMIDFHNAEVVEGKAAFTATTTTASPSSFWCDGDFTGRLLADSFARVDALPKHGNMIFETMSPVVNEAECSFIVEEARETIANGLMTEQELNNQPPSVEEAESRASISNSQLGEARLSNMPKTKAWLQETLVTRFYPLLKDRFGIDDVILYDGLVLSNIAPTRSQPIHRDASLLTLNVALSSPSIDYEGGGTFFEGLHEIITIKKGHLLCHAGSALHAGNAITRGTRWVFVLFLLGENQPQLARRCHAQAIEYMHTGELDLAEEVLQTGLKSIAPHHDHLLHNTLGRLYLQYQNRVGAMANFRLAHASYPYPSNDAGFSIARMHQLSNRPRAALRMLDVVLSIVNDRDHHPQAQVSLKSSTYAARRDAARCALICVDYLYNRQQQQLQQPGSSSSFTSWTLRHLPIAIDRMKTCLVAAPNEPMLLGMLNRAEFLYNEAQNQVLT